MKHIHQGKATGSGGKKVGNALLTWAVSEAACRMIRSVPAVTSWTRRQEKNRGTRKALSVLEAKIGRVGGRRREDWVLEMEMAEVRRDFQFLLSSKEAFQDACIGFNRLVAGTRPVMATSRPG